MKLLLWLLILCSPAALAAEVRESSVTLNDGTRIHLLEAGQAGAKPALVFIPGWTLPAFLWKEQMQRFSSDRLVIAIDPRSQGDSTKTESSYECRQLIGRAFQQSRVTSALT